MSDHKSKIRAVLKDHGKLTSDISGLADEDDLYTAGMTSHASVNVMLALEGQFDLEFPDRLLKRSSFQSVAAIESAIKEISGGQ